MPKTKAKQRVYLSEEEKKLLAGLLEEWNSKTDKKSRDNFISAEALPKIQALNMSQYGPDIISTDKAAKLRWENRIQVSTPTYFHYIIQHYNSRRFPPGLKTTNRTRTAPSLDWKENCPFVES